ncbi:hypothetical protein AncyloWKF20_08020 [Ancylobacter sp. WKF20]|uniref:hypothetical protein n=1 Tax=Ancylobacter sp. WKF20 TaxID=3039801 RepID=UPI00243426A1|nr:hypothetical protein [Ancylobacter sp. WKF20]WGD31757.1 hypothetical protein AncyloWKF20_08020 [Ancylobacter sp. WKF20]
MANGDPFSNNVDKAPGTPGHGVTPAGSGTTSSSYGSGSAASTSGSARTSPTEGLVAGRSASAGLERDARTALNATGGASERRFSFNMLLATAVAGYAIGRLLPR